MPSSAAWSRARGDPPVERLGNFLRCWFIERAPGSNVAITNGTITSNPTGLAFPEIGVRVQTRPQLNHAKQNLVHGSIGEQFRSPVGARGPRASQLEFSVGHSRSARQAGRPGVQSIWVYARSASSRWLKYFEHSTRVVTRLSKKVMVGVPVHSHCSDRPALAVPGELILQHLHPLRRSRGRSTAWTPSTAHPRQEMAKSPAAS